MGDPDLNASNGDVFQIGVVVVPLGFLDTVQGRATSQVALPADTGPEIAHGGRRRTAGGCRCPVSIDGKESEKNLEEGV